MRPRGGKRRRATPVEQASGGLEGGREAASPEGTKADSPRLERASRFPAKPGMPQELKVAI